MLPVVYNDYDGSGIYVEKADNGSMLIPFKTITDTNYSTEIDQLKQDAQKLIDEINEQIDEYNLFV